MTGLQLLFAAVLVAHALIHGLYFVPAPPRTANGPAWPFDLGASSLVQLGISALAARRSALVLFAGVVAGFTAAASATLGVLPAPAFDVGVLLGGGSSLALLSLFFQPWLVLGIGIDVVLLVGTLLLHWTPPR